MINVFKEVISKQFDKIDTVLDIGCAYGTSINDMSQYFQETTFIGVDPGSQTVELASKKFEDRGKISFKVGYMHNLPIEDTSVDVVVLNMVLQWVPRSKIIASLAEIDRVLKPGGCIYIQDFDPYRPLYSVSHHNESIYIFKDDYPRMITSYPWFSEIHRRTFMLKEGEDQRRSVWVIQKNKIEDVYSLRKPVTEVKKG